jgi:hypothetical protein
MAAVAHVSPAAAFRDDVRRLALVRTGPFVGSPARSLSPATVYRRRRAVALLVAVTVIATLVLAFGAVLASFAGAPATPAERPAAPGAVYVVQPGDTFWDIARRLQPGGDPRPLVARLVAAHGSAALVAGERLALPAPA